MRRLSSRQNRYDYVCTMECRKRSTPVASATSKFACRRMCARPQDHCDGSVLSSRLLPARKERKTQSRQKLPLLPTSPEGAHKRPPMQGVLAAGRQNRPLVRQAPGAWHHQGTSRPHPSLAVQGATVLRAGLFRRGASFTIACLPFSPLSLRTHRHLHCHASTGPRWRKSERRRSERV